jgi:alpha-tubulin suppressor-like RCC1 family protein
MFLVTEKVDSLSVYLITRASCGSSHTLAVNEWGQVFSWGSDSYGQLGKVTAILWCDGLRLSVDMLYSSLFL